MLSFLHIENAAVIKNLDIGFSDGFTVFTGETGSGKSIIIDCISLLNGARGSKELIRTGESSAKITGLFENFDERDLHELELLGITPDEDGTIEISRTIFVDGRSQAKINSRAVQVSLLRDASKYLLNIHSQHESQLLLDTASHIQYLDLYTFKNAESDVKKAYSEAYESYRTLRAQLLKLEADGRDRERTSELLSYQLKDIDSVKPKPGEDIALEERRKKLQNAEKLQKSTEFVYRALSYNPSGLCACALLDKSAAALNKISDCVEEAAALAERLESLRYEIEDIGDRAHEFMPSDIDDATAELDRIEARLDALSKLKRKYGGTIDEVLAFRNDIKKRLDSLEMNEEMSAQKKAECKAAEARLKAAAEALHEVRASATRTLEAGVMGSLEYLDMSGVRFEVSLKMQENAENYTENGADTVEFLIATGPGEDLKSMARTASGGELSRIMLALKSELLGCDTRRTVIFDEIDTGVSGKTSEKIGLLLKRLAQSSQVLSITHSAQIAAIAAEHMYISKSEHNGRYETEVKLLDFEERVRETARIIGGVSISEKQLAAARELVLSAAGKK